MRGRIQAAVLEGCAGRGADLRAAAVDAIAGHADIVAGRRPRQPNLRGRHRRGHQRRRHTRRRRVGDVAHGYSYGRTGGGVARSVLGDGFQTVSTVACGRCIPRHRIGRSWPRSSRARPWCPRRRGARRGNRWRRGVATCPSGEGHVRAESCVTVGIGRADTEMIKSPRGQAAERDGMGGDHRRIRGRADTVGCGSAVVHCGSRSNVGGPIDLGGGSCRRGLHARNR